MRLLVLYFNFISLDIPLIIYRYFFVNYFCAISGSFCQTFPYIHVCLENLCCIHEWLNIKSNIYIDCYLYWLDEIFLIDTNRESFLPDCPPHDAIYIFIKAMSWYIVEYVSNWLLINIRLIKYLCQSIISILYHHYQHHFSFKLLKPLLNQLSKQFTFFKAL